MIRVGIVGCGFIGRVHSFALKALIDTGQADAALTAVLDPDETRAAKFAAVQGVRMAIDLDDFLDEVDAAWICTPTSSHLEITSRAADARVAVMCEKPLGRTLAEAEEVAAALAKVQHRVGLVLRCSPVFRRLREEVSSGRYGRPMAAVFRDDQWFPVGGMYGSTWRAEAESSGTGTLLEHSIHDLDLLRWLFGDSSSVSARTANFAGHDEVEDLAVVHLEFPGGVLATLTSIWHRIQSRPSTRRLEVFCEDGFLWLDDDTTGPLHVETGDGAVTLECPVPEWASGFEVPDDLRGALALYAAPAREFLEDLASGGNVRGPDAADALVVHRIVDAAYRSAAHGGRPVDPGIR